MHSLVIHVYMYMYLLAQHYMTLCNTRVCMCVHVSVLCIHHRVGIIESIDFLLVYIQLVDTIAPRFIHVSQMFQLAY